jgi:allophanate hydrolase subunit 2
VLLADRQTTGGYPKIATVAAASLPALAQARPGDALRFEAVSAHDARELLRRQRAALAHLPAALVPVFRDPRTLPVEALLGENLIDGVVGPQD